MGFSWSPTSHWGSPCFPVFVDKPSLRLVVVAAGFERVVVPFHSKEVICPPPLDVLDRRKTRGRRGGWPSARQFSACCPASLCNHTRTIAHTSSWPLRCPCRCEAAVGLVPHFVRGGFLLPISYIMDAGAQPANDATAISGIRSRSHGDPRSSARRCAAWVHNLGAFIGRASHQMAQW